MKGLIIVTGLVTLAVLILLLVQRNQERPPYQDTHTGILKGSVYDCAAQGRRSAPCDEIEPGASKLSMHARATIPAVEYDSGAERTH
jgi:hypothetical protein